MPDDVPLRLHLCVRCCWPRASRTKPSGSYVGAVLQRDPGNAQALSLLREPGGAREPDPASTAAAADAADQ